MELHEINPIDISKDLLEINDRFLKTEGYYTEMYYPKDKTIHELFEEQAKKTPNNYALVYMGEKLTYKELNERSNVLAGILKDKGAKKESIVGIISEKSFDLFISILAVLKSGCAYLILDPEYPDERIKFMLENSKINILIRQSALCRDITYRGEVINIDDGLLVGKQQDNLVTECKPNDLAYVIYTSGSTGMPKGVMVEHRNILNTVYYLNSKLNTGTSLKVSQFFSPSFTVCYQELFLSLLFGGELHIIDNETKNNIDGLLEFLREMQTNVLFLPTSYIKMISTEKKILDKIPDSIKHIITAGEQLIVTPEFIKFLSDRGILLHNNYGTSETNMVTMYTIEGSNISKFPPIGKPIANTRIYLYAKDCIQRSTGYEGELIVSGEGVSRGYINNPKLTMERFIHNPHMENEIMYRTGDIVRILPDGNIEYLGRTDFQLKVRGYRIESGEIEYHLLRYPSIKEAAVVARKGFADNQYLCAFIVPSKPVNAGEIKEYLSERLPEYMIPTYIIKLDKLPRTPTGKINRLVLSEWKDIQFDDNNINSIELSEKSEVSRKIINIIMDLCKTYTGDNSDIENAKLFDCGIDSLTFIKLVSILEKEFEIEFDRKYLNANLFENIKSIIDYVQYKIDKKKELEN